jgi:hypothetical protein
MAKERERVVKAGGFIENNRVNGTAECHVETPLIYKLGFNQSTACLLYYYL